MEYIPDSVLSDIITVQQLNGYLANPYDYVLLPLPSRFVLWLKVVKYVRYDTDTIHI